MSTILVILAVLFYAGPCMLAYHLGKKQGYSDGYLDGEQAGIQKEKSKWDIPKPNDFYR